MMSHDDNLRPQLEHNVIQRFIRMYNRYVTYSGGLQIKPPPPPTGWRSRETQKDRTAIVIRNQILHDLLNLRHTHIIHTLFLKGYVSNLLNLTCK